MDTDKLVETPTQIENVTEPRRSGRVTRTLARYRNLHENVQELFVHGDKDHVDDSTTYEEAISDTNSSKWLESMKSEMDYVSKNQVWDLVDPPEGIVPIGNKWVFKRKIGANGKVETYKARLVANAILKSIRIILVIAAHYDYEDLGEVTYILDIQIYRDRPKRLIGLSQALYLDKVLKRFNMQDSKRRLLSVRHCIHFSKTMSPKTLEERKKMAQVPYALAIGNLMYAMLCTRPDIAYAVSVTSSEGAVWIRKYVTKLDVVPSISSPVELYCDKTGAIPQAK
ncbi:hypothetical protein CRG98_010203 [Punica granatum]|uniref:Reverse transcriptase Ty1/copia-type domain-containing protein n=1 Tax=Punica granatum TaxID=22663 RepID=A0A2I0KLQ3_PUNGR|nr:hypothetical protein CRG98_010203 [Punica granatum]